MEGWGAKKKKEGGKRTISRRARRPWQACGGNDKSVAVIARDEKQHLSNEARQRLPLGPARERDAQSPQTQLSSCQLCCLSELACI